MSPKSEILSYYRLLRVTSNATADELKQAYRKRALEFHPDTNGGDQGAAAMFVLIKNAYETLSDQTLRLEVDSYERTSHSVRSAAAVAPRPGRVPKSELNPYENDLNYLLWDLDDLMGEAGFSQRFAHPVLDFLTYLDKWVLMPAGFNYSPARDAREGARDPRSYIDRFVHQNPRVKCEFRSIQDYFFNVKHRVMGFQSWTDPSPVRDIKGARLMARLDSMRESLLYHLMRSQRIGFFYMFEIDQVRKGHKPAVAMFEHEVGPPSSNLGSGR